MKVAVLLAAIFAAVVVGCGGSHSAVQVHVAVTSYPGGKPTTKRFSLGCDPVSGSLPLRTSVCRAIAAHHQAMLAPVRARWTCVGGPFVPTVRVDVENGSSFSGMTGCSWPGGTPLAIYFDASRNDATALRRDSARLRCEDDPALLVQPTPSASAVACVRGLWTRAAERTIRAAKHAVVAPSLFPDDPGVVACRIRAGGPSPGRVLAGRCGVSLSGPSSAKLVHFVEAWGDGGHAFRHRWTVRDSTVIAQDGPIVPQLRR